VVEYLRQAASALDKAHAMGIAHGDLRLQNLFVTLREDGSPFLKLLDFGVAKLATAEGARPTGVAAAAVTPHELLRGGADAIGPPADVWALGLVAFTLLTGRSYFTAATIPELHAEILAATRALPSARGAALGPAFDAWLMRCLADQPSARWASAGDAVV